MPVDVEGIAPRLRPSVEEVTFPFDATKRAQVTVRTTHDVIDENGVEFNIEYRIRYRILYRMRYVEGFRIYVYEIACTTSYTILDV